MSKGNRTLTRQFSRRCLSLLTMSCVPSEGQEPQLTLPMWPTHFENYHKLRRSSSKCIHDYHCGSQLSSAKRQPQQPQHERCFCLDRDAPTARQTLIPPMNRRNILVMKHNYSQEAADACDIDEIEEVPTTSHRLSRHEKAGPAVSIYRFFDDKYNPT